MMTISYVNIIIAQTLMATGFKGKLSDLGVTEFSNYEKDDARVDKKIKEISHNITIGFGDQTYTLLASKKNLTAKVGSLYKDLTDSKELISKPFGEFIKVIPLRDVLEKHQSFFMRFINKVIKFVLSIFKSDPEEIYLVSFGEKSFRKPAIATDAVHILRGKNSVGQSVCKLVGIIRGFPPGKGKGATVGGFNNVDVSAFTHREIFDSAISTAISESDEEIAAKLTLSSAQKESLRIDYNKERFDTEIELSGKKYPVKIIKAGEFKTSDNLMSEGGESIENGSSQKRVHVARSVLVYVDLEDLNIEDDEALKHFYKPGDDAAKILVTDVTDLVKASNSLSLAIALGKKFREEQEWGIIHHGDIVGAACFKLNELLKNG